MTVSAEHPSVVATRFAEFCGRTVFVVRTRAPEPLIGRLTDVIPAGRSYFLRLVVGKHARLISVNAVLEIGIA